MNKTININIPEGFEIDIEKSNLLEGTIAFKEKEPTTWRKSNPQITGFYVDELSDIIEQKDPVTFGYDNVNIFATKKQAKSMLAIAQISQIIQNDQRFGGTITDDEWKAESTKYTIDRYDNEIIKESWSAYYHFIAFHTQEQRDLFFEENMDLIKQYYMLD